MQARGPGPKRGWEATGGDRLYGLSCADDAGRAGRDIVPFAGACLLMSR